ncbi:MAG: hypothetical protein KatS3mg071_1717 [Meiothermus sp.]|nr:MAG: hypothetical protein KatS3mg071_1717 [Meiothermus sp.]
MEALFVVLAAMGLLFTGAGLLIALVEEVLGPIWEGWMGMESYGEDPSPRGSGMAAGRGAPDLGGPGTIPNP